MDRPSWLDSYGADRPQGLAAWLKECKWWLYHHYKTYTANDDELIGIHNEGYPPESAAFRFARENDLIRTS
jgi:hypothetical protein